MDHGSMMAAPLCTAGSATRTGGKVAPNLKTTFPARRESVEPNMGYNLNQRTTRLTHSPVQADASKEENKVVSGKEL